MNTLSIANINIRQDAQGRYCLADLHQAAGSEKRHSPSYWLTNKNTRETIDLLKLEAGIPASNFESEAQFRASGDTGIPVSPFESDVGIRTSPVASNRSGEYADRGTFVVWELVYDYAMWVSPAFKIKVIRAYNTLQTRTVSQSEIYWFARRPRWEFIRRLALEGWPYRAIAKMFDPRLGQGSIANSVQAMVARGLINPQALATAQHGVSRKAAERRVQGWGTVTTIPTTPTFSEPQPKEPTVTPEEKAAPEAENSRLRAEVAANKATAVHAANVAFCEGLPGVVPAWRAVAVATLDHLAAQPAVVEFGEGGRLVGSPGGGDWRGVCQHRQKRPSGRHFKGVGKTLRFVVRRPGSGRC